MNSTPTHLAKTAAWVSPQEWRRQITILVLSCLASFALGVGTMYVVWAHPHNSHVQEKETVTPPQREKKEFSPLDKKAIEKLLLDERYKTATRTRVAVLREIDDLLKEGWKRELLIEDGKVLTIKSNRAAIGSKEHGFTVLEYDTYPVLAYRVERKDKDTTKGKAFGYGIAGDLHHPTEPYLFPFLWIGKSVDPPEKIQQLKLEKSRLAIVIP